MDGWICHVGGVWTNRTVIVCKCLCLLCQCTFKLVAARANYHQLFSQQTELKLMLLIISGKNNDFILRRSTNQRQRLAGASPIISCDLVNAVGKNERSPDVTDCHSKSVNRFRASISAWLSDALCSRSTLIPPSHPNPRRNTPTVNQLHEFIFPHSPAAPLPQPKGEVPHPGCRAPEAVKRAACLLDASVLRQSQHVGSFRQTRHSAVFYFEAFTWRLQIVCFYTLN